LTDGEPTQLEAAGRFDIELISAIKRWFMYSVFGSIQTIYFFNIV
jgi:hypothetical protein